MDAHFYYQPLSLLFVKPKQWLDVPTGEQRLRHRGQVGGKAQCPVASVWGCNRREIGQAAPPEAVYYVLHSQ